MSRWLVTIFPTWKFTMPGIDSRYFSAAAITSSGASGLLGSVQKTTTCENIQPYTLRTSAKATLRQSSGLTLRRAQDRPFEPITAKRWPLSIFNPLRGSKLRLGALLQNSNTPSLRVAGFEDDDEDENEAPDQATRRKKRSPPAVR
jgi:hypothetical protein